MSATVVLMIVKSVDFGGSRDCSVGRNSEGRKSQRLKKFDLHDGLKND